MYRHGVAAEWGDILHDLDRLQEIELEQDGKRFQLRTPTIGVAGKLFFRRLASPCRPMFRNFPLPASQSPAYPGANTDVVVLRPPHVSVRH